MSCARVAPALLLQVSLLLAVLSGAGLASAARLKWDPSTYIALRELLPTEYRVTAVALCAGATALLALAHLAALALALPARLASARRALLLTHAALTALLLVAQVAWVTWSALRVAAWLESAQASQLAELLAARDHLDPLLLLLARWHPLPARLQDLMQEAAADAPRNLHVGYAALALAGALQPVAALLALLSAARARGVAARSRASSRASRLHSHSDTSYTSTDNEKAPLRTAFKNGKLVIL